MTIQFIMELGKLENRTSELMCGQMVMSTQAHGKAGRWKEKARSKWHTLDKFSRELLKVLNYMGRIARGFSLMGAGPKENGWMD